MVKLNTIATFNLAQLCACCGFHSCCTVPAACFTAAAACGRNRTQTSAMPQEAHLAPSHEDVYAPCHEDVCYNEAPKSWSWRDEHLAALCIALARGCPGHCSVGHSCEWFMCGVVEKRCFYIYTYTYTHLHIHIHTYIYMYIHIYKHTHIHTYSYTHIYTHTHTHFNKILFWNYTIFFWSYNIFCVSISYF